MRVLKLSLSEILKNRVSFLAGALAVALAAGSLIVSSAVLASYDNATEIIIEEKSKTMDEKLKSLENDMRKAMLKLSFNLVILPKDQELNEWYTKGYSERYMPDDYAEKLVNSEIVLIRHLLPILQQKVEWPEKKRTIILVGTRGEVPNIHKAPKKPMVQPVPEGKIVLGYELHQSLGLKEGEQVQLMGKTFTVHKCYGERGSKDDITAWISLKEAQQLLNKEGRINAILALECVCVGDQIEFLGKVRAEIMKVLPDTQVIEQGTKALVRAEARLRLKAKVKEALVLEKNKREDLRAERKKYSAVLIPLFMGLSAICIIIIMFFNVRDRQNEVGIFRAMGVGSSKILMLFLMRPFLMGVTGGVIGTAAGLPSGLKLAVYLDGSQYIDTAALLTPGITGFALLVSIFLPLIAGWLPVLWASQQDPARIIGSSGT